jgi:hypothetical protein
VGGRGGSKAQTHPLARAAASFEGIGRTRLEWTLSEKACASDAACWRGVGLRWVQEERAVGREVVREFEVMGVSGELCGRCRAGSKLMGRRIVAG